MNKKRVALALAAALSVNTLMVTVGQVGQQAVVAHAVDGKLTNQDDINKLNGLKIKTLKSEVTISNDGKEATLSFPELNNEIKSVAVEGNFEHKVFTERNGIDEEVKSVTSSVNGKSVKLSDVSTPGIYTGKVKLTFNDGKSETYTVSVRKTPADSLKYTVNVGVGTVEIKGLTLNNGVKDISNAFDGSELRLLNKRTDKSAVTLRGQQDFNFNILELGGIQEGDVLELSASYGAGVGENKTYKLVSTIIVKKQATPKIESAYVTNDTNFEITAKSKIEADFASTPNNTVSVGGSNITVNGQELIKFNQTKGQNNNVGGAELEVTPSNMKVDLKIKTAPSTTTTEQNYVNGVNVAYGINNSNDGTNATGLIGDYTLSIAGQTITYFDAMSGVSVDIKTSVSGNSTFSYIDLTGAKTDIDVTNADTVSLDLSDKLTHGYSSVAGEFKVDKTEDWKIIDEKNKTLESATGTVKADIETDNSEDNINFSLIVAADTLDGYSVNAKFEKTSESEGTLTLVGGKDLQTSTKVTVEGANVDTGTVSGNDVTYRVQFNGIVPTTINWKATKDSTSFGGALETGTVEALNITKVEATNVGTESVPNQFQVNANFNFAFPSGSALSVDGKSNRVTLEQFSKGSHTLSLNNSTGKYQGTYTAGVVVEQQSFVISLKDKNSTSSSATVTVQGTNIDSNALNNVTKATLQYKEKNSNNWINDVNIDVKNIQSTKEFDLTKSNLSSNTEYEFRIKYEVTNGDKINEGYTNTVTVKTSTSSSSNSGNGTITGNGSSSTSGTSTGSTNVNVTSNNLTVNGSIIGVRIPTSIKYDSSKTPVVGAVRYKDNNGKTITETNDQFKGVTARFNGDSIELEGLVPGKQYVEVSVDYTDNNGKVKTIVLKNFKFDTNVESDNYLANIYNVVFTRPADETGYQFHLNNLKGKNVSLREFVLNMLTEKEFIETYDTTEKKIEALYNAIVNRKSDENGKKFWVEEYRKVLAVYGSESTALKAIAERMVNENELKALAEKLNFVW